MKKSVRFAVGTYTEPILFGTGEVFEGKGEGLYLCEFDGGTINTLCCVPLVNPSFLCIDEARRRIYAVGEAKETLGQFGGSVSEVSYDEALSCRVERTLLTGGTDPCHVALSPDGRAVAVANFASGALSVFPLDADGRMTGERQLFEHAGSSVHPKRQTGPHAHSGIFVGDLLFVPDLGLDQVVAYRCEGGKAAEAEEFSVKTAPGSGPRYGEFSPDGEHFYLINEIASTVSHYRWDGKAMTLLDTVSTLPADFAGENICADLHLTPDGRFLYASNRGHDSLAVFAVEEGGALRLITWAPSGGRTPRQFQIDPSGTLLFVGNQDSDNIRVYAIGEDGMLAHVTTAPFPSPVCIRFFHG